MTFFIPLIISMSVYENLLVIWNTFYIYIIIKQTLRWSEVKIKKNLLTASKFVQKSPGKLIFMTSILCVIIFRHISPCIKINRTSRKTRHLGASPTADFYILGFKKKITPKGR